MKVKLSELNENEIKEIEKRLLKQKEEEIIIEEIIEILYKLQKLYCFTGEYRKRQEIEEEIIENVYLLFDEE
jgi:uncharacterized protein VirK/YbjX